MSPLEIVLNKLREAGPHLVSSGGSWQARCPAHDDRNPSLAVSEGADGKVLLNCHAGCSVNSVVAALGIPIRDLFPPRLRGEPSASKRRVTAAYEYTDESGHLLFEVLRYEPKRFSQRQPDGQGGWIHNLHGVRRVLYRLPAVVTAVASGCPIWIVEGEKDADALVKHGVCATTNSQGAGSWRVDYSGVLLGADVVVVADHDDAGRKHAGHVVASLRGRARSIRLLVAAQGKDATDHLAAGGGVDDFVEISPEPNPLDTTSVSTVVAAAALDEVARFLDRFMSFSSSKQRDATTLWIGSTYVAEEFGVCAYLHISSPEKRSGKSLLMDLGEELAFRGRSTANISPAALYRVVEQDHPTLFFDEIDNIFAKGRASDPVRAELAGLINAGYRRGRPAIRMGGANMREVQEFDAFGPKALAGIGECLPDTTADRCIPIRLQRKAKSAKKERYRLRLHQPEAQALGRRLGDAMQSIGSRVGTVWPDLPEQLNDRQQDIWEPLLAIADLAGGTWPNRARSSAVALHQPDQSTESTGSRLLADLREVFTTEKMLTKALVERLNELEEAPWSEMRGGQGISGNQLVSRLRAFEVRSKPMRTASGRGRGFELSELEPLFERYTYGVEEDGVESADEASSCGVQAGTDDDTVDDGQPSHVRHVNALTLEGVDASVDTDSVVLGATTRQPLEPSTCVNTVNEETPATNPVEMDDEDGEWKFTAS